MHTVCDLHAKTHEMSNDPESIEPSVHGNVRDVVKSIKSGELNKPDAFMELRAVLKQSRARANGQADGGESVAEIATQDGNSNRSKSSVGERSTQFTRESRHAIISQIIEKKKQQRLSSKQSEAAAPLDDSESFQSRHVENGTSNDRGGYSDRDGGRMTTAFPTSDYDDRQEYCPPQHTPGGYDMPRERPQSAGRMQSSKNRLASSVGARWSADDNQIDSRNVRVMQYESRLRNEIFKECTFQPQIKLLPASYGAMKEKDTPFLTRVQHWQREKELAAARRKSVADRGEVTDCTFKPKINRNSSRAAREMRPVDLQESTAERLYRNGGEVAEQKARFLEEERRREQELEIQDCTFQPELKTSSRKFQHVTPKFDRYEERQQNKEKPMPNRDCTFTPKVRGVRKSMDSAALYVCTDVVERLTRPFGSDNQRHGDDDINKNFDSDRPIMDMASFMGTIGTTNTHRANFAGTTPKARPSSAPHQRGVKQQPQLTQEEKEEKKRNYEAFLHRQNQTELRKAKHVDDVSESRFIYTILTV